jgi:hypothetical protein
MGLSVPDVIIFSLNEKENDQLNNKFVHRQDINPNVKSLSELHDPYNPQQWSICHQ